MNSTLTSSVIALARRSLPLMCPERRREAERIIGHFERTANAGSDPDGEIAAAWEKDLQPVRTALAAALHARSLDALAGLRTLLPGLLREVNAQPRFSSALAELLSAAFSAGFNAPTATANAADDLRQGDTPITDARRRLGERAIFETDMGSAELRGLSQELRNRIIFVSRCTNAEFLQEVKDVVDDILAGKINQATGRLRLLRKLKELGYDPAVGFPQDMADIPPAEKDSLQDLSSMRRLDLIIETNVRMATNYGRMLAGNEPYALREYPAWQLKRLYLRDIPRGTPESKSVGWDTRWHDAGTAVNFEGALQDDFIARKDSPIWQALGDGEGGYTDTLLNPFPPFAFRSGMGWVAVPRDKAIALGLVQDDETPEPMEGTIAPQPEEVEKVTDKLSPEFKAQILRELEALGV